VGCKRAAHTHRQRLSTSAPVLAILPVLGGIVVGMAGAAQYSWFIC
jgi:hypothetical protein